MPPSNNSLTSQKIANNFKNKIVFNLWWIPICQAISSPNIPCLSLQSSQYFSLLTTSTEDVAKLLSEGHLTTCSLDPIPSQLLRSPSCSTLHFLTHIFILSHSAASSLCLSNKHLSPPNLKDNTGPHQFEQLKTPLPALVNLQVSWKPYLQPSELLPHW